MDIEKRFERKQKDLHQLYSVITEDIRFAKTQMWRIFISTKS